MICKIKDNDNLEKLVDIIRMKRTGLQCFYKASHHSEYFDAYRELKKMEVSINTNPKLKKMFAYVQPVYKSEKSNKMISFDFSYSPCIFIQSREFLYEVVTHELAHAIEFLVRGDSDHGTEWQKIHMMMGGSGSEFCDAYDVIISTQKYGSNIGTFVSETKIETSE